jgi:hypothetical protein
LEYIGTNQRCDEDFLKESLDKAFENKGEEIMHTLADKLVNKYSLADKWIDKGKREGKKEGKREGKTQLLSFLFEERFGNVPQQLTKQINQADDKLIEDLTRSFLRFQSINSGRLLNADQGIANAHLFILNKNISALTDTTGQFKLINVPTGTHTIQVNIKDHASILITNVTVNASIDTQLQDQHVALIPLKATNPIGDSNGDGVVNIKDAIQTLQILIQ